MWRNETNDFLLFKSDKVVINLFIKNTNAAGIIIIYNVVSLTSRDFLVTLHINKGHMRITMVPF